MQQENVLTKISFPVVQHHFEALHNAGILVSLSPASAKYSGSGG